MRTAESLGTKPTSSNKIGRNVTRLAKRKVGTAVPSRPRFSRRVEDQRASVMECGAAYRFEAESSNQKCRPFRVHFFFRLSNPGLTPPAIICRPFGAPRLVKRLVSGSARGSRADSGGSPESFRFVVEAVFNQVLGGSPKTARGPRALPIG